MANVHRDRTLHPAPFSPSEFLPDPLGISPAQARMIGLQNMHSFEASYQVAKKSRPN